MDGLTLLTPTGDRHFAFSLCERWMAQQAFSGPIQWIVVDDGQSPTEVTQGQQYVRREPSPSDPEHTLCRNMLAALPLVNFEKILIIEDDDYYSPEYLQVMHDALDLGAAAGEIGAKYYWIANRRWRHFGNHTHVSWCRTAFRAELIDRVRDCATENDSPSLDMRFWDGIDCDVETWRSSPEGAAIHVGIKGLPGRRCGNGRPWGASPDPRGNRLKMWIGADAEAYLSQHVPRATCS